MLPPLPLSHFSRVRPHRWQPTRLLCPWDSPGNNTGVGCHFLLQDKMLNIPNYYRRMQIKVTMTNQIPLLRMAILTCHKQQSRSEPGGERTQLPSPWEWTLATATRKDSLPVSGKKKTFQKAKPRI